ncbi:THAP domain-containing protein 11 [Merluccius polli]|uniref:THAP domain-containing protein 1 n=1 Tax=Merluccius polli TaxID=89951 RepID=A0AA47M9L9_MERPO|nr:THAP domain-containing protein 11 [Merluccius polli]
MVDNCCAPGCTNKRGKKKCTSFYRIPKDAEMRAKWISAIKRARSKQNKTERWDPPAVGFHLCSDHFISGRKSDNPLSPDFVPSIFNYVPSPEKRKIKMRLEMTESKATEDRADKDICKSHPSQSINRLSPRQQQGSYCRPNSHHRAFEGIYP